MLIAGLTGLLLVVGMLVGGRSALILFASLAIAMNLAMYWFSAPMALKMSKAVPVSESVDGADGSLEQSDAHRFVTVGQADRSSPIHQAA